MVDLRTCEAPGCKKKFLDKGNKKYCSKRCNDRARYWRKKRNIGRITECLNCQINCPHGLDTKGCRALVKALEKTTEKPPEKPTENLRGKKEKAPDSTGTNTGRVSEITPGRYHNHSLIAQLNGSFVLDDMIEFLSWKNRTTGKYQFRIDTNLPNYNRIVMDTSVASLYLGEHSLEILVHQEIYSKDPLEYLERLLEYAIPTIQWTENILLSKEGLKVDSSTLKTKYEPEKALEDPEYAKRHHALQGKWHNVLTPRGPCKITVDESPGFKEVELKGYMASLLKNSQVQDENKLVREAIEHNLMDIQRDIVSPMASMVEEVVEYARKENLKISEQIVGIQEQIVEALKPKREKERLKERVIDLGILDDEKKPETKEQRWDPSYG